MFNLFPIISNRYFRILQEKCCRLVPEMPRNSNFWYRQICSEVPDLTIFGRKMVKHENLQKASKRVPGTSWVLGECFGVIFRVTNDFWTIFEKVAFLRCLSDFRSQLACSNAIATSVCGVLRTSSCARSIGAPTSVNSFDSGPIFWPTSGQDLSRNGSAVSVYAF